MNIESYACGAWTPGNDDGVEVRNAINGEAIGRVSSQGLDFAEMLNYGRRHGGSALRQMAIHDRANMLKALAKHLLDKKEAFYAISAKTGATRADGWVDIEGGIGTVFAYSGIARRELPNETFAVEGNIEQLSAKGSFLGRHILTAKHGVSLHINAFNFPCWGMLEKIAPSLIAGVPVIVKPATVSSYLTEAMAREIIASGILPEGALQLICGRTGDIFDHLNEQDSVTFTGSASTGRLLKGHPNIVANSIPFNMEAVTVKAGQKCTAIRRAIVPQEYVEAVIDALKARLDKTPVGDPAAEGVRMGALVGTDQVEDVWAAVDKLADSSDIVHGGERDFEVVGADRQKGAFFPSTLLYCDRPFETDSVHSVEAFGPVSTIMPYKDEAEAIELARMGRGSLVGSLVTADDDEAARIVLGIAAWHGRILVLNSDCAKESTGHGSPLAPLVHGGPGRAGGGEELGGSRAIKHYMQRTAIQGSPDTLTAITRQFTTGATAKIGPVHPFRKTFDELEIGETLITHRRTVTEADIVNFGCISGDHFYAHFDELAAKDSLFGKRVAHGYFIISAAAGMFVDPAPGPVLANYGLENLRFVEPVGIGDTIQVRLTVKEKIRKAKRPDQDRTTGVVVWDVEVKNQKDETVAIYDILTLVERADD
jgi:oxepin-CoA hydrolase/3-oxo-5,6-dehydrosuberyl-CoA semialdehyde dehydrogenase